MFGTIVEKNKKRKRLRPSENIVVFMYLQIIIWKIH